jgi:hypothetical protein
LQHNCLRGISDTEARRVCTLVDLPLEASHYDLFDSILFCRLEFVGAGKPNRIEQF